MKVSVIGAGNVGGLAAARIAEKQERLFSLLI